MPKPVYVQTIKTPYGPFQAAASETGITRIVFPPSRRPVKPSNARSIPRKVKTHFTACGRFLNAVLAGRKPFGDSVRIDWSGLGEFQKRVLKALRRLPPGAVISYGELANRSGAKRAARAVGSVLKHNPIPMIVPCHRVVRSDRSLGGFQSGLRWKRILLGLEQSVQKGNRRSHR